MRLVNLPLALALLAGLAAGCESGAGDTSPTPEQVVERLAEALYLTEAHRVVVLVNRDDCRLLEYQGGRFSMSDEEWCVRYAGEAGGQAGPFTTAATEDLDHLVAALDVGRTQFWSLADVSHSEGGQTTRAAF